MKWNKRFYTQEKKKERDFLLENRSVKLNETAPKYSFHYHWSLNFISLYIIHDLKVYLSVVTDTNKYQIYNKLMNGEKLERI